MCLAGLGKHVSSWGGIFFTLFTRLLHTNSVILLYSTPQPIQLECIKRKRKSSFFSVSWTQNHQFLLNRNQNSMQQNNSLLLSFWYENVNVGHFVLFFSSSRRMLGFFFFLLSSSPVYSIDAVSRALSPSTIFAVVHAFGTRVCMCARVLFASTVHLMLVSKRTYAYWMYAFVAVRLLYTKSCIPFMFAASRATHK